jgi:hypothetical protein
VRALHLGWRQAGDLSTGKDFASPFSTTPSGALKDHAYDAGIRAFRSQAWIIFRFDRRHPIVPSQPLMIAIRHD